MCGCTCILRGLRIGGFFVHFSDIKRAGKRTGQCFFIFFVGLMDHTFLVCIRPIKLENKIQ